MKKKVFVLLLVLALAMGLCVPAAAAPVWSVTGGGLSLRGLTGGQHALVAGYDENGQFLGAQVLAADGAVQPDPAAAEVRLFWTGGGWAPLDAAIRLPRDYQVRKVGDQVELSYTGPGGVTVTWPVTQKTSGRLVFYSDKQGKLCVGGKYYSATRFPVDGCAYDVTQAGFQDWSSQPGVPNQDTLDFYLDPWGNICWIDLVEEYHYSVEVCLLLSAELTDDNVVRAELMHFNGSVFTADVSILGDRAITDPAAAADALTANAPGGFYACQKERNGTYSMSLMEGSLSNGWNRPLDIPAGTVTVPAADFTGGAVNCVADETTLFMVVSGPSGQEAVTRYTGYQALPAMTLAEGSAAYNVQFITYPAPEARFVYLRVQDGEPPANTPSD